MGVWEKGKQHTSPSRRKHKKIYKKGVIVQGSYRLFFVFAFFVLALPAFCEAKTIRLSYSSFFPAGHAQSQLAEAWAKEVEKRTQGRVVIDFYPGGTLTKGRQCFVGVENELSDLGQSVLAYTGGRFPVMSAVDLPLGYKDAVTATKVANAVWKKFLPKELGSVQVMYFHAHGPGILHTKDKAVHTLEDLKGLKIRATGNSAKLVKALGGTPVAMGMGESYLAIKRGVVHGGMYPLETNKGWKMGEAVKFATKSSVVGYTSTFFVVMNKDKWQGLPVDIQNIILAINSEWTAKHAKAWDVTDKEGREFFLEKGGTMVYLDKKEAMRWKERALSVLADWEKTTTPQDVAAMEVLQFIQGMMEAK